MGIATETTFIGGGGDYRWLASARGTEHPKSGTVDLSSLTPGTDHPNGYIPSGLPVKFNSGTGLYVQCDDTDTAATVAGFVWHDVTVRGTADVVVAILTDVTIVAALVPGDHDLVDGRYLTDHANDADTLPEED